MSKVEGERHDGDGRQRSRGSQTPRTQPPRHVYARPAVNHQSEPLKRGETYRGVKRLPIGVVTQLLGCAARNLTIRCGSTDGGCHLPSEQLAELPTEQGYCLLPASAAFRVLTAARLCLPAHTSRLIKLEASKKLRSEAHLHALHVHREPLVKLFVLRQAAPERAAVDCTAWGARQGLTQPCSLGNLLLLQPGPQAAGWPHVSPATLPHHPRRCRAGRCQEGCPPSSAPPPAPLAPG